MSMLEALLREGGDDLSKLPKDVLSSIKKNIRKGAENLEQKYGNALELVHKAYEVDGVERPDPTMKTAWNQYEEIITYAVKQLADNRGIDDDWRMSSAMFHESVKVNITGKDLSESYIVKSKTIDEVMDELKESNDCDMDIKYVHNGVELQYSKWGIRKNVKVTITK